MVRGVKLYAKSRASRYDVWRHDTSSPVRSHLLRRLWLVLFMGVAGCGGSSEPSDSKTLAGFYAEEFGVVPPAGVKNLRGKHVVVGDAEGAWLRFEATPELITQLTSRFTSSDSATFDSQAGAITNSGHTPVWWKPKEDSMAVYYINTRWRDTDSHSQAVLAHDKACHIVYFHPGMSL